MPISKFDVAFAPVYHNPYQHLLTAGLCNYGIDVHHLTAMPRSTWLKKNKNQIRILHLHWLYGLYMRHWRTPAHYLVFFTSFWQAKQIGYKIVWTSHNIMPHRQPFPPMHQAVRRLMMSQADAVITHCEYGRAELLRRFPRSGPVYVVPIGTYTDVYPADVSRKSARTHLNIKPDQFVYLFLGNISTYKGLKNFVNTYKQLAQPNDVALIAGRNRNEQLTAYLENEASQDSRLRIHAGYIPDDEMQFFLRAADVMAAPFTKILTSSSVIVGMSYGLPVIVPDLGCLPELVTPEAGIVYSAADPQGLAQAMIQIKNQDTAVMGQDAKKIADSLQWDDIARQTAVIYRTCLNSST